MPVDFRCNDETQEQVKGQEKKLGGRVIRAALFLPLRVKDF